MSLPINNSDEYKFACIFILIPNKLHHASGLFKLIKIEAQLFGAKYVHIFHKILIFLKTISIWLKSDAIIFAFVGRKSKTIRLTLKNIVSF